MKVFILTEGGRDRGFGHITRCLSISEALEEKEGIVKFIVNGDDSILELLRDKDYRILNWLKERDKLFEMIAESDMVIIDSYLADFKFYKDISSRVELPVYIDDNMRLNYPDGVVVNGSIFAEEMPYPKKEEILYLLGIKYFPLRKEFWEIPEKKIREDIKTLLVTFGGDDIRGMTKRILELLTENYPDFNKKIIIGKGFNEIRDIDALKDENTELIYYPDGGKMKKIMMEADLSISLGGQTLYELARVGVPTIAVAVADNQLYNIKGWQRAGFMEYAGWWEEHGLLDNINHHIRQFQDVNKRMKSYKAGRSFINGKGSRLIIENLLAKKYV